jgi:hypothetical protein
MILPVVYRESANAIKKTRRDNVSMVMSLTVQLKVLIATQVLFN